MPWPRARERYGGELARRDPPRRSRAPTPTPARALAAAARAARAGDDDAAGRRARDACAPRSSAAPSPPRSPPSTAATPPRRATGCCCASSARRRASPARAPTRPSPCGACRRAGCAPAAARDAVAKDLLDAYQARLRELLDDAARGRGARPAGPPRRGRGAGRGLLRHPRRALRAGSRRRGGRARRGRLRRACATPRWPAASRFLAARAAAVGALDGFTAAPFTPEEAARRAQQLLRFLALVPVEYGRGVHDRRVTLAFEVQEAVAFRTGRAERVRRPARPAGQARPGAHRRRRARSGPPGCRRRRRHQAPGRRRDRRTTSRR